jgi:pyruvate/2-oxoglutarate dehydrogenase complex dihydrolipoamide acyltransferase (E2) component
MFSGVVRHACALVTATAVLTGAPILTGGTAAADTQDDKFFELLGENDVPAIDNATSLIDTGHKVCARLDGGMSVNDLVELIRNNGFNENPMARLYPQGRITATIDRFITAAVQAYCPSDAGKITSIAAYHPDRPHQSHPVVLASLIEPIPAGEIPPTKPLPVPALPPLLPENPAPAPEQPPPPPQRAQQAPQRQQPVNPAPQEAPPQEAPPQVEAPQAPAPAPEPGGGNGGNGGAPAPESPAPAPPAPPGHIRLAP